MESVRNMAFEKEYMPQFRDAEESGLVGIKGYMNYFQDMVTHYMHNLGKGNDTLPEEYGITWLVTKYKMKVLKAADYTAPIQLKTWIEPGHMTATLRMGLVISRADEIYAKGSVECALLDIKKQTLTRLSAIDFPTDLAEDESDGMGRFRRFKKDVSAMQTVYTHRVRYTDLDKANHMTNLKYVDLFLNAFDGKFYRAHPVTDFEIHYLDQCREGASLEVRLQKRSENGYELAGIKEDETLAVYGYMETKS